MCDMPRLNELWNEARWVREKEQNSFPRKKNKKKRRNGVGGEKKEGKKTLWMSGKVTGECTISYNSDLNPTKKKERERKRKVTLQWPWNYWFHRESLREKRAQLLRVLTTLGPDRCFRASRWIYPVVFSVLWQFSHKLARNNSSPCAQQLPSRCDNWCSRTFVWKNQQTVFIFPACFPTLCYSTVECDQWHQPSGVTSALYVSWLICRSTSERYVTWFLPHQIVIDGAGWPRSGSWYLTSIVNVPGREINAP